MPLPKKNILDDFLQAAEKTVRAERRAAAAQARAARAVAGIDEKAARQQERQEKADRRRIEAAKDVAFTKMEKKIRPLIDVLLGLSQKDGTYFSYMAGETTGYKDGSFKITFSLSYGPESAFSPLRHNMCLFQIESTTEKGFAECRAKIGNWVARVAPDRVAEVKALVAPKKQSPKPKR